MRSPFLYVNFVRSFATAFFSPSLSFAKIGTLLITAFKSFTSPFKSIESSSESSASAVPIIFAYTPVIKSGVKSPKILSFLLPSIPTGSSTLGALINLAICSAAARAPDPSLPTLPPAPPCTVPFLEKAPAVLDLTAMLFFREATLDDATDSPPSNAKPAWREGAADASAKAPDLTTWCGSWPRLLVKWRLLRAPSAPPPAAGLGFACEVVLPSLLSKPGTRREGCSYERSRRGSFPRLRTTVRAATGCAKKRLRLPMDEALFWGASNRDFEEEEKRGSEEDKEEEEEELKRRGAFPGDKVDGGGGLAPTVKRRGEGGGWGGWEVK